MAILFSATLNHQTGNQPLKHPFAARPADALSRLLFGRNQADEDSFELERRKLNTALREALSGKPAQALRKEWEIGPLWHTGVYGNSGLIVYITPQPVSPLYKAPGDKLAYKTASQTKTHVFPDLGVRVLMDVANPEQDLPLHDLAIFSKAVLSLFPDKAQEKLNTLFTQERKKKAQDQDMAEPPWITLRISGRSAREVCCNIRGEDLSAEPVNRKGNKPCEGCDVGQGLARRLNRLA
ncbi:MAG: hypothetical protein VKJ04_06880 [Vampirovibrionales bacterium]|nr:hypothetical protein [Vampirovibrionales bacterium]